MKELAEQLKIYKDNRYKELLKIIEDGGFVRRHNITLFKIGNIYFEHDKNDSSVVTLNLNMKEHFISFNHSSPFRDWIDKELNFPESTYNKIEIVKNKDKIDRILSRVKEIVPYGVFSLEHDIRKLQSNVDSLKEVQELINKGE